MGQVPLELEPKELTPEELKMLKWKLEERYRGYEPIIPTRYNWGRFIIATLVLFLGLTGAVGIVITLIDLLLGG